MASPMTTVHVLLMDHLKTTIFHRIGITYFARLIARTIINEYTLKVGKRLLTDTI